MGKKSAPPAPDYKGAAEAQSTASQDIANQQTYANRPDVNTPWGKQTWTPTETIDPATGKKVTKWASNIDLDPDQQAALDDQMRIQAGRSDAAGGLLDEVGNNFSSPMDWSSLPSRADNIDPFSFGSPGKQSLQTSLDGSPGDWRQRAQDAVTKLQAPMLAQRRQAAQTQLANQGIAQGSEAYSNAMRDVDDAETRAGLSAIESGRGEADQMFGQALQGAQFGNTAKANQYGLDASEIQRQLGDEMSTGTFNNANRSGAISEESARRGMPLNELNALLNGEQVTNPFGFGGGGPASGASQAPDYMSAMQNQYNALLGKSQQNAANTGQAMSAATSAALMYLLL